MYLKEPCVHNDLNNIINYSDHFIYDDSYLE